MRKLRWFVLLVLFSAIPARAEGPPSQAILTIEMPASGGDLEHKSSLLEGGTARIRAAAINGLNPRTVRVAIGFRYVVPPDTIALDEILDRIVVETVDGAQSVVGSVSIDPNDVNLNPNGARLGYRATRYRPEGPYTVRVNVFGNYE